MKVTQSCLPLCDPMDYTVHGVLQARKLEWVSRSLLQGIFLPQGLNPGLPHYRHIIYPLSHQMKNVKTVVNPTGGLVSSIQTVIPKAKSTMAETVHQYSCAPLYFPVVFRLAKWGHMVWYDQWKWMMGLITATSGLAHTIALIIFHADTLWCWCS